MRVVRMNGIDPRPGLPLVETLPTASPNLFVSGADVNHLLELRIREPEDFVNVFGHLAEAFLGFAERFRGAFAFRGYQPALWW